MSSRIRDAVRAVVLDPDDRLLLMHFAFADGPLWGLPGGGIDPGETIEAAIIRELHEEAGLVDVELGPVIWTRTHMCFPTPEFDGQRETIFLARTIGVDITPAFSAEELLAEFVIGSRWWTLDELVAPRTERFSPRRLPMLVHDLLTDGPPAQIIDTGV